MVEKKKNRKYSFYLSKINKIEQTRKRNNKNWMNLLKLCFRYNPNASKKILKEIFSEDKRINRLVKDLLK